MCGCSIIRSQTQAQLPSGGVNGVVTGPSGPVAGAVITITPSDNSYHALTADAGGYYSVNGIAAGPATLAVAAAAYRDFSAAINIPQNATVTVNVSLTPL